MSDSEQNADESAETDHLELSAESEADLIEWMAAAGTCQNHAQAAFAEFHRRHAAFLFAQCLKRYRWAAEDIVQDTLIRVYERAETFDRGRLRGVTPSAASRAVRAWMCSIAHQIATEYLACRTSGPQIVTAERITSLPDITCVDPAYEVSILDANLIDRVRQAIDELPPRDSEIAWVIAHHWSPNHNQNRWSAEDLDAIAERYGVTREYLRKIRSRLITKLRTHLTPILAV